MFNLLYCLEHKSRKWFIRIFYWILSSAVINGYVQYKIDYDLLDHGKLSFSKKPEKLSLFRFTGLLATLLIENVKPLS